MPTEQYNEAAISVEAIAGWKNDPSIQREFTDVLQYFHFLKAELQGKFHIIGEQQHVH